MNFRILAGSVRPHGQRVALLAAAALSATLIASGAQAQARAQRRIAVLYVDLDYFSTVVERWGQSIAERLLKRVAERQEKYWDALAALELAVGHPLDAWQVFPEKTLDTLEKQGIGE